MSYSLQETYNALDASFSRAKPDEIIDVMLDSYQRLDEALNPLGEKSDVVLYMILTEAMQLGCAHDRPLNDQEKRIADFIGALFTGIDKNAIREKAESECEDFDILFSVKIAKVVPEIVKPFVVFLYCCIFIDGAVTSKDQENLRRYGQKIG